MTTSSADRDTRSAAHGHRRITAALATGSTLNPINSSLVAVALAPILAAYGEPQVAAGWLISGLYVATAVGQPAWGHLADLLRGRTVYLVGLAVVAAGGIAGAIAPTFGVLVAARIAIGLGTSAAYPAAMVLLSGMDAAARRRGTAWLTIAGQITLAVGPTVGGVLTSALGWRSLFFVNTPVALLCALGVLLWVPASAGPPRERTSRTPVDAAGIAGFGAALAAGLAYSQTGATPFLVVCAASGLFFLGWELYHPAPFIDVRRIVSDPLLVLVYGRHALTFVVHYSFLYGWTQWLETARGYSPAAAGAFLLPSFALAAAAARLASGRATQHGVVLVGLVGTLLASLIVWGTGPATPVWLLVVTAALFGLPEGLLSVGHQIQISERATGSVGSLSGLLRTAMYAGAIGSGILVGHTAGTGGAGPATLAPLGAPMVALSAAAVLLAAPDAVALVRRALGRRTA